MSDNNHNSYLNFLQSSGNFLLVKDSIGKPKPSTRDLPGQNFTYGKPLRPDAEGVGSLISSWAVHKSSFLTKPDKDFKKLNKLSVAEGACTASKQSRFRVTADIRLKSATQRSQPTIPDMIFGIENRPSTPIKAVMGNFYGEYASEKLNSGFTPKSIRKNIPIEKSTRGFDKRNEAIKTALSTQERKQFKLKKYETVKSKTYTGRN